MNLQTFENTLKEHFPKLTWKYIKDGAAGAELPLGEDDRTDMIDPSLSNDRDSDGQWTATIYLNDRLTFDAWESTDLQGCLIEIKDKMRSIQFVFNNSL